MHSWGYLLLTVQRQWFKCNSFFMSKCLTKLNESRLVVLDWTLVVQLLVVTFSVSINSQGSSSSFYRLRLFFCDALMELGKIKTEYYYLYSELHLTPG